MLLLAISHMNSDFLLSTSLNLCHWYLAYSFVLALPQIKGTLRFDSVLQVLEQILGHLGTILRA